MAENRWEKTNPLFAERVRATLARKAAKAAAIERAQAKKLTTVQLVAHPGETLKVLPSTARGLEKIRQIAQGGSSPVLPEGHKDEELDEPKVVMLLDQESQVQARLGVEFHKPRYRLTWRISQRLGVDEKQVQAILAAVPKLFNQISSEKKQMERLIREIYVGDIESIPSRWKSAVANRAEYAARKGRPVSGSPKRSRRDNGIVIVQL